MPELPLVGRPAVDGGQFGLLKERVIEPIAGDSHWRYPASDRAAVRRTGSGELFAIRLRCATASVVSMTTAFAFLVDEARRKPRSRLLGPNLFGLSVVLRRQTVGRRLDVFDRKGLDVTPTSMGHPTLDPSLGPLTVAETGLDRHSARRKH